MMRKTKLSIIVPCYNEEKNIPLIVDRYKQIKDKTINTELILVDNGSTDNSNKLIKKITKKNKDIKLCHVKINHGYGFGIWSGLKSAKGEYICWTHADMQTDLKDTFKAYKLAEGKRKIFVKGHRKGRPVQDQIFTSGMSLFESLLLGKILYDINAQPNLFHHTLLERIKNPPKDFAFDLFFYYKVLKLNYKVKRFRVKFTDRIHGESNWNTSWSNKWKFIKRTIEFSLKMKRKIK